MPSIFSLWIVSNRLCSSAAKLAYAHAQKVIDGQGLNDVQIDAGHKAVDIENDIKILQSIAKKLRNQRFQNGALSLDSPSLSFKLDENGLPADCGQYERTEANTLIEEVCLCAIPVRFTSNLSIIVHAFD